MPSLGDALKSEIVRLARKEVKREMVQLRKQVAAHRTALAAMKRQLADVERLAKKTTRVAVKTQAAPAKAKPARFSAKGLKTMRTKLGLSAADIGRLLGVSGQSVYNWEGGASRPRPAQVTALQSLRGLGKRAILAKLEDAPK